METWVPQALKLMIVVIKSTVVEYVRNVLTINAGHYGH